MSEFNCHRQMLIQVAEALGEELLKQIAFVGGCTTGFFITDDFTREQIRNTNDVDIIVHVLGFGDWCGLQETLRSKGFQARSQEEVICAMYLDNLRVDFMPDNVNILGFTNRWYADALKNAQLYPINADLKIPLVQSVYFIATKLEAYLGRGNNDPLTSTDLEDIINLFDGREELCNEITAASPELRCYIATQLTSLLKHRDFEYVIQSATKNNIKRENLIFDRLDAVIRLK
ncbi:hypothetical protein BegalDRAFT_2352 [Beggiatoa alba B18LD]|uniref:Uncharacterized protein n=1 Tax=Beggiatoa alba B18LD TaxID=395493 RepID=I3CHW3_9GAMM|nr:hypothetical protein [Beggiatoa alba]EIJ43206.1 hypothetical protein BegalDRAFT_2352 [Beggiatoa alba B18LD]